MTLFRTTITLLLLTAAVLLVAGCAGQQGEDRNTTGNLTIPMVSILPITSQIPSTAVPATTAAPRQQCQARDNLTLTVADGDSVSYQYMNPDRNSNNVRVWIFGTHFVNITTLRADYQGSISFDLSRVRTHDMGTGCYRIIIQYPPAGNRTIKSPALSKDQDIVGKNGTPLFNLEDIRKKRINGLDAAVTLENELHQSGLGEDASAIQLVIEEPWIRLNPVGDHVIGEKFTIDGTTNLAPGNDLVVIVFPVDYRRFLKSSTDPVPPTIPVMKGQGENNTWSFYVDTASFTPEEYSVSVAAYIQEADAYQRFFMHSPLTVTPR